MLHAVLHAHALERLLYPALPLRRPHPAVRQRQLHIFVNGQVANQVERLENEPDLPVADARPLRHLQPRYGLPVQIVGTV
jgi:hypothetical protein